MTLTAYWGGHFYCHTLPYSNGESQTSAETSALKAQKFHSRIQGIQPAYFLKQSNNLVSRAIAMIVIGIVEAIFSAEVKARHNKSKR